jgi:general secretion pathway protein F
MRTFDYRGFDGGGARRRGLVEATDLKEAREKLAACGILAERLSPAGGGRRAPASGQASLPADQRVVLYRELGVLLAAGLPLVSALDILIQSPELGAATVLLAGARDRVREGAGLAAALKAAGAPLATYEEAILEVGERAGDLDDILERLAAFLEEQQRLRERIVSALIYPAIIFGFALCVAVVMLGFVVPSAAKLLMQEARVQLPLLTRVMIGVGRVLVWGLPLALAAGTFAVLVLRRRLAADPALRRRLDRALFGLPVIGRGYRVIVNLRCARTLAMLLKGGVPLLEALPLAGRTTGSAWVAEQMLAEAEAVKHGSSLADAIRRVPVLAASLPAWIQAGEASGALEKLLDTAGDSYQHQWNRFSARMLSVMEPVLIALIGAFVLLVVLSVLLPIVSLNRALG